MCRILISFVSLLFTAQLWAQSVSHVKCLTQNNTSKASFNGLIEVNKTIEHPNGFLTIIGQKIETNKVFDSNLKELCRSWYIRSDYYWDTFDRITYTFDQRNRGWNVIRFSTQSATIRMTCAVGSIITQYDSVDSFLGEYRKTAVEVAEPRPGSIVTSAGFISGEATVSSDDCIINQI